MQESWTSSQASRACAFCCFLLRFFPWKCCDRLLAHSYTYVLVDIKAYCDHIPRDLEVCFNWNYKNCTIMRTSNVCTCTIALVCRRRKKTLINSFLNGNKRLSDYFFLLSVPYFDRIVHTFGRRYVWSPIRFVPIRFVHVPIISSRWPIIPGWNSEFWLCLFLGGTIIIAGTKT